MNVTLAPAVATSRDASVFARSNGSGDPRGVTALVLTGPRVL